MIDVNRLPFRTALAGAAFLASAAMFSGVASASPSKASGYRYDGSWNLVFVTQSGVCDRNYDFTINITRGMITHPNLVRFRGSVSNAGATRASVRVGDKSAFGSGRLSESTGQGNWSGYSGNARCSGRWTAQKN